MKETKDITKENPNELAKDGIEMRVPDKEILIIGCKDKVAVDLVKATFHNKFRVYSLDNDLFYQTVEKLIKKIADWDTDRRINDFSKDPERIKDAMQIAYKVETKINEVYGEEGHWFFVDDLVDNTNFTFKQARTTLDMLFTFGFVAKDIKEKKEKWLMTANPIHKLKYIDGIISDMDSERKTIQSIRDEVAKGVDEALKALSEIKKEPAFIDDSKKEEVISSETDTKPNIKSDLKIVGKIDLPKEGKKKKKNKG